MSPEQFIWMLCWISPHLHLFTVVNDLLPEEAYLHGLSRTMVKRLRQQPSCSQVWNCADIPNLGVDWQFNVERAPWWGGAFERLICSMKRCLKVGRSCFSLDEITTAVAEIEARSQFMSISIHVHC